MNWDALGAVAETVGAIGVIGTLLYIAVQVRQANQDSRIDAHQQVTRDTEQHLIAVANDQNVEVFIKGLNAYGSLTPPERVKFDLCAVGHVNLIEETLVHAEAGKLEDVRDMLSLYLGPRLFAYSGFREWWEHDRKAGFAVSTQSVVDDLIERNRDTPGFWEYQ
jgi:hypothetical protein